MYIGVDGCPGGWFAIKYDEKGYRQGGRFDSIERLWAEWGESAERILIDVPIGLRESSNEPRGCDRAARERLGSPRHSSVFPTPIRPAAHSNSYEDAKAIQERETDGSLGVQSWGIAGKIAELDTFLREEVLAATEKIREAHPEVCFWALAGERAMAHSKTGQPAAAFWERVNVLEATDESVLDHIRESSADLDVDVANDDVVDTFALALTASPLTGELRSLPEERKTDRHGLPMEIVYAPRS